MKSNSLILGAAFAILTLAFSLAGPALSPVPVLLNPLAIPKWVNQLDGPPPVYVPTVIEEDGAVVRHDYNIGVSELRQQILPPGFPQTLTWGYGGMAKDALTGAPLGFVANSPAPSFEAIRGIPIQVKWISNVYNHFLPVDPSLHWADPNNYGRLMPPVPPAPTFPPGYPFAQQNVSIVTHLHGGEVRSDSDGHPEAWWTWDGRHGPYYNSLIPSDTNAATFYYPNDQQPTTLWYHDHALGVTRINVLSGLAGYYFLRDPADPIQPLLPSGKYEMPLAIQDRNFMTDGSFFIPAAGDNPTIHPYWQPEFFGAVIMVNGKVWPNMNVDRGVYRLRLLDGSNARFYTLSFKIKSNLDVMPLPFVQIGSDGGYLKSPALLSSLTIAPGERADILIDFSSLAPGTQVILRNTAKSPFPNGATADPMTVGRIMRFTVTNNPGPTMPALPVALNPTLAGAFPNLPAPTKIRYLTLWEVMGVNGPIAALLNGQEWHGDITEKPQNGTTEEWVIVNLTGDAHPIHLHLVQFQLAYRQAINAQKYTADWLMINAAKFHDGMMPPFIHNAIPTELPVAPYLKGMPMMTPPNEQGWKDTVQMFPGQITVIRVRWAAQDGSAYTFDPNAGPGYVWHCHILEHEDNEMMRPYKVQL